MTPISPTSVSPSSTSAAGPSRRDAESPEEAARQFEAVLVRQFVEVMTKDLFDGGEEGGMTGQADLQRDTLTDTLTDHLVDSGTFGVADLMIAQWRQSGRLPPEADTPGPSQRPGGLPIGTPSEPADALHQPDAPRRSQPMTMDEALRLYPPAQGRPVSFDHDPAPLR